MARLYSIEWFQLNADENTMMQCPKCQSNHVQFCSAAVAQGTFTTTTAHGRTLNTMTNLAKEAGPDKGPMTTLYLMIAFCLLFGMLGYYLGAYSPLNFVFLSLAILLAIFMVKDGAKLVARQKRLNNEYQRTLICRDCLYRWMK